MGRVGLLSAFLFAALKEDLTLFLEVLPIQWERFLSISCKLGSAAFIAVLNLILLFGIVDGPKIQ